MRVSKTIGRVLKIGTLWCTLGLIGSVLLQIYARFFMDNAPSWTEEASRLLFIYAVSFASGLAVKNRYYVHLDTFYNSFGTRLKKNLILIIPIVNFILFGVLTIYSIKFVILGIPEKSPSLGFSMAFAFCSISIMGLSVCFYTYKEIIRAIKNYKG